MARVSGPLMSFSASGKIADALVFASWKGRDYVRQWFKPGNPQTIKQVNIRTAMTLAVEKWQSQLQAYKDKWNEFGKQNKISGFNSW